MYFGLRTLFFLSILLLSLSSDIYSARSEGIFALVNGNLISTYDVEQRVRLISLSIGSAPSEAIVKAAADELIIESLKKSEAKSNNVVVAPGELQKAIEQIARNNEMDISNLRALLLSSGIRMETLEEKLRAEIIWGKFINQKFEAKLKDSQKQLEEEIPISQKKNTIFYDFRRIIFLISASLSRSKREQILVIADKLSQKTVDCSKLDEYIDTKTAVIIQPTVSLSASEIGSDVYKLLLRLKVGNFSKPQRIQQGYAMILLCDKEAKQIVPTEKLLRYTLSSINLELSKISQNYIFKLRKKAVIEFRNKI